jgi:hypothetical protein
MKLSLILPSAEVKVEALDRQIRRCAGTALLHACGFQRQEQPRAARDLHPAEDQTGGEADWLCCS